MEKINIRNEIALDRFNLSFSKKPFEFATPKHEKIDINLLNFFKVQKYHFKIFDDLSYHFAIRAPKFLKSAFDYGLSYLINLRIHSWFYFHD